MSRWRHEAGLGGFVMVGNEFVVGGLVLGWNMVGIYPHVW